MNRISFIILISACICSAFPSTAYAQIEEQCPHLNPILPSRSRIDTNPTVREQLIKLCINEIKEDYERLLDRSEEIALLSSEIRSSFVETRLLSKDDMKKLDRLQSLAKKVRNELRASDDNKDSETPESVGDAIEVLEESSSNLFTELKKAGRHSISLLAVQSSNALMRSLKFLKLRR